LYFIVFRCVIRGEPDEEGPYVRYGSKSRHHTRKSCPIGEAAFASLKVASKHVGLNGEVLLGAYLMGVPALLVSERNRMVGFAATAIDWLNAYRRNALEPMIHLYDDKATQTCSCDVEQVIAGKQALRAYWIGRFKTHQVYRLVRVRSEDGGVSVLYQTNNNAVLARLLFNDQDKIVLVVCGHATT
jgi:hypothetical protein